MADFNRDRVFETGADCSSDAGKPHPSRAWSPLVIAKFAEYMRRHNCDAQPKPRREDQWQLGFPQDSFIESAWRHLEAVWAIHQGYEWRDDRGNLVDLEEALCGVIFNVQGYLHQLLFDKLPAEQKEKVLNYVRERNGVRRHQKSSDREASAAGAE